jgi:hypothetical protein
MPKSQKRRAFETTFNLHPETGFLGEGGAGRSTKLRTKTDEPLRRRSSTQLRHCSEKRFKNEIAFCSKKSSPHIVAVLDHGTPPLRWLRYQMSPCPICSAGDPRLCESLRSVFDVKYH